MKTPFDIGVTPDADGFLRCIRREGEPRRVHLFELYLDPEIQQAICDRYGVLEGLDPGGAHFELRRQIRLQSFLGYDYVRCGLDGLQMPMSTRSVDDTAAMGRDAGRQFEDEHTGPVATWEQFEKYDWPDPARASTEPLEWLEKNLPDNMCVMGNSGYASSIGFGRFFKSLSSLMGYETMCYALYEQRDLVAAIVGRVTAIYKASLDRMLEFERVRLIVANDDMGFKTGTLVSPGDLRELILPAHKLMAQTARAAGRPYVLHSCGNLALIMDDLIDDVRIDAKHSFEDVILPVAEAKRLYGGRIAILGGIDMDAITRGSEAEVRARACQTLEACMPGGGYCLGTGNTVANYVPVDNYLAMMDEGRKFGRG
ncbi:MAG: uroporphyrinogen decarboxylase family protein [bacterium]